MAEYDNDLARIGVIHYKVGEFEAARRYLERALEVADDNDTRFKVHFHLALMSDDPIVRRRHLDEALALEPTHIQARRELAILDGKIRPEEIVNPDALPAQSADPQQVTADRFICPQCGGRMVFDGDGRTLICEYCARDQAIKKQAVEAEQDFLVAMATGKGHRKPVAMQTFHCQGCGAEFILPPTVKSVNCAYCGSSYVIQGASRELVEPDAIVPMGINARQAVRALVNWVRENKIEPQGKVQPPRGVYLPFWTFDITGNIPWQGQVYENDALVYVSGTQPVFFNDVCVPAIGHHTELLMKLAAEFNFSKAPAYDPRYLAGWPAEVYERSMSDASLDARQQAGRLVRQVVQSQRRNQIGKLSFSASGINIMSFKLVLLPAWITEYRFENKPYAVLINGSTGMTHGETPRRGVLDWLGSLFGK